MRKSTNNLPEKAIISTDSFYIIEEKAVTKKYVVYAHNHWSIEEAYSLDIAKRLMEALQYAEDVRDEVEEVPMGME